MDCPKCQFDNPDGSKFCNQCGAKMELTCAKCNRNNPSGSRFCNQCGERLHSSSQTALIDYSQPNSYTPSYLAEKILKLRNTIEGERKQVSVLFCDISNSTHLAEQLGAEVFHGAVSRFFELSLAEVHRYEGSINQFLGDGFMALFGAPIACEDHGRRAVLAAIGIQKKIGKNLPIEYRGKPARLALRMGIHTGSVVVGAIGDNLRMDYTAVGDTTNIAARLQQSAAPEQILVSGATRHLVRGYCNTRKMGDLQLKGKADKVPAWQVITARKPLTRFEVESKSGLTRFVGRQPELEMLQQHFAAACSGKGQIVSLVGEAGIGKSRLLLEFRRRLGERDAKWLEGHALSFGKSMAFHPLMDMFKRVYHIEEKDPEETIVEKITQGVLQIGDDLRPILPYLRYLLTFDSGNPEVQRMAPQLRRSEIFRSMRHLLIRASTLRPQVLVFEDLHWFDQATEESLVFLANSIPNSRVLVLCTYRPGYANPIGDRTFHSRIVLSAISATESMEIARSMLAAADLPETFRRIVMQKAEGNPMFVEEIVKSLRDAGVLRKIGDRYQLASSAKKIQVPATLQDVLMARIDRLDFSAKRTLQIAAVIGREFSFGLLNRLSDTAVQAEANVQTLENAELIESKQLFPELVYRFKHALMQEVAYRSMLKTMRQHLHQQVGAVVEEIYPDRLAEFYEVLAYHFARGEDWPKALDYFVKAGQKASASFAVHDAIAQYQQALEAAERLGDARTSRTIMEIHKAKSDLHFVISEFEAARVEGSRLLDLARQNGDRTMEGDAQAIMGWTASYVHEFEQALDDAGHAIEIGRETGQKSVMARGHIIKGHVYSVTGRIFEARPEIEIALAISRSVDDEINRAAALRVAGLGKSWEGKFTEGAANLLECIRIAQRHNLAGVLIQCYFGYGITLTGNGDYEKAFPIFEEGLELAEKIGEEAYHYRLLNGLGWLFSECGDLSNALEYNHRSAESGRKRGDPEIVANAELNLADVCLLQEERSRARKHLDTVHRLVNDPATREWMKWRYTIHLYASYGEYWLAGGDLTKAEQMAKLCIQRAKDTASRKYLVKGLRLMGEICRRRSEQDAAVGWLQQAVTSARAIGNPTQLYTTWHALGRSQQAAQQPELARDSFNAARQVVRTVGRRLPNDRLQKKFERLPIVEQVRDAG